MPDAIHDRCFSIRCQHTPVLVGLMRVVHQAMQVVKNHPGAK